MSTQVYLIGAGPGDPGLLTLRAVDRLSRCDVVLYDGLANAEILAHAPQAEHISVGKHGQSRIWKQPEIIAEMLSHAARGRVVGRLKGGDPAVFARTTEEVDALVEAGMEFEIVPGITAALAAGSFAGIPITHRGLASAVALVTGHEEPGKAESALDWDALAKFPGTLVVYMGVTTAKSWTSALIAAGKDPATPVAIVRRCSLPDQQQVHCRLDEVVSHLVPASKFRPPVITIIGPVTELGETMHWLARRPLFGKSVLVTRPADQSSALADPLADAGAHVRTMPAIEIGPLTDPGFESQLDRLDEILDRFDDFDTVVFCSPNGVRHFLDRFLEVRSSRQPDRQNLRAASPNRDVQAASPNQDLRTASPNRDLRSWGSRLIGAVGTRTAQALGDYHLGADLVPDNFRGDRFVEQFASTLARRRVLVVRASRGSDSIADGLRSAGVAVEQVVAYAHRDAETVDPSIPAAIDQGALDWITVTSSATAENLHRLLGDRLRAVRIASLSPVTSQTLVRLGYTVDAQADPYTMTGLVDAIVTAETGRPNDTTAPSQPLSH